MSTHPYASGWLSWLEKRIPPLFTPHGVMLAVITMYIFKVVLKGGVGGLLAGSLVVGADGIHNTSDIFEASLVILVVSLARDTGNSDYPFGRRNLESIFVLLIGFLLGGIGLSIFCSSGIGIAQTFFADSIPKAAFAALPSVLVPETHTDPAIFNGWYPVLACIVLTSIALSFVASRIQMAVGHKHQKPSIVADGQETRSDGIIESAALIGISGEYFFQAPWIEYPFGLAAGILILRVAYELGEKGYSVLIQKSLGDDLKSAVKKTVEDMQGVIAMEDLKIYPIGSAAIVEAKVLTPCNIQMGAVLKQIAVEKIGLLLEAHNFPEYGCYLRMAPPPKKAHRVAYLLTRINGVAFVSSHVHQATHIRIVDMEYGKPMRIKDYPATANEGKLEKLLAGKRVSSLIMRMRDTFPQGLPRFKGIAWGNTLITDPREIGIDTQ